MGWIRNKSQLFGAVGVVAAIVVGAALPIVLSAAAPASSLAAKRAPVAACSPPAIAGPAQPVADASPPCNPTLKASPHKKLRDGQIITITGSGFPANDFLPVLECQTGATTVEQCDTNVGNYAGSDSTGAFSIQESVVRLLSTGTATVDCAQKGACVIAALNEDNETIEAAVAISFKNVPLPTLTVSPSSPLSDGQNVTVAGANFPPGLPLIVVECPAGQVSEFDCDEDISTTATAGSAGTFSIPFDVARILSTNQGPYGSTIDCAAAPGCVLAAFSQFQEELVIPTPLVFDPAVPPLAPLDLNFSVNPTGQIVAGGAVNLSGTISCTSPTPVDVSTEVDLLASAGPLEASSSVTVSETCDQTAAPVTLTLPEEGVPFDAGFAQVTLDNSARDGSAVTQDSVSGTVTLSVAPGTPPPVYYVALGDTLATGSTTSGPFNPNPDPGYANDLVTALQAVNPNVELVDLGCFDETTTSMIEGGDCEYAPGPQLEAATAFLDAHRASVALITIDIGGFDEVNCISAEPPFYNPQCFQSANQTVSTNLTSILSQLRTAAGSSVPIVGMNYFDPFLAEWPGGGIWQTIAKESVPIVGALNSTLGSAYAAASVPVADVQSAFQTTDLKQKTKTSYGRVPVAVANVCNWLNYTCTKGTGGFAEDTNPTGAGVIAGAFEKVLPAGLTTAKAWK